MLGELNCVDGRWAPASSGGAVGFVPQIPLVISGSVQENILMGRPLDSDALNKAVQASQLAYDLTLMPAGLNTRVGERGQMLSGGQQARIGIARALYTVGHLLILDDPLAAVDPRVARGIFDALRALTPSTTVVLSLNQLHLMKACDRVVELREGGLTGVVSKDLTSELLKDEKKESESVDEAAVAGGDEPQDSLGLDEDVPLRRYARAMGCWLWLGALACLLTYTFMLLSDRWIAKWIDAGSEADTGYYAMVYGLLCLGFLTFAIISSFLLSEGSVRAGRGLHEACLEHVAHAPLEWFERIPCGRILSRFSSDLANVDSFLPMYIDNTLQFSATLIALVVLVCWVMPIMVAAMLVGLGVYGVLVFYVRRANHACKQIANHAMAPVMGTVQETVSGHVMLRAMNLHSFCTARFDHAVDNYNKAQLAANAVLNWGMNCSYLVSGLLSTCSCIIIVVNLDSFDASEAGLALAYSFTIPYFLLFLSFNIISTFMYFASLQRLLQYQSELVPQEPEWHADTDKLLAKDWPLNADIVFSDVVLRYNDNSPPALRGLTFSIEAGQRVGVAGRTGAGKSSLLAVLFRSRDPVSGSVSIGGVPLQQVGLQTLRRRLAVIPQRPMLISGSVLQNLDPFQEYQLGEHTTALSRCGLLQPNAEPDELLKSDVLDLSTGQQQLLTLARAMLRCVSIICMDEPTSQVDPLTDKKVQQALKDHLPQGVTVLTIAHRIDSILGYDRILVLQDGKVLEWGTVAELRADPGSELQQLIRISQSSDHDKDDKHTLAV